tara:strand:- start:1157 stop:1861 length:705 start_codon:yes stop_codon:yes gene_type:complete
MDLKKSKVSAKLSNRQELLLSKLKLFYSTSKIKKLLKIINGETKLSLRIIDWFVTNYTKKNNVLLYITKSKPVTKKSPSVKKTKKAKMESYELPFNIYLNYKSQLKAYSKKNFDPFCRRERINFYYNNDEDFIVTTIGQLNFFKWAIENNVLDYIEKHIDIIESDMNKNIKRDEDKVKKSKKKEIKKNYNSNINLEELDLNETSIKKRRKRRELSTSANNSLNRHNFSITLEFN